MSLGFDDWEEEREMLDGDYRAPLHIIPVASNFQELLQGLKES